MNTKVEMGGHETLDFGRLDYGAVPLDPYRATDPRDFRSYETASMERISDKLTHAMLVAIENEWVIDEELILDLDDHLNISLLDSQKRRIDKNAVPLVGVEATDPRIIDAKNGVASPSDLLGILIDYPGIGSLELAKLSHPLDAQAPRDMDVAVLNAIEGTGGQIKFDDPRYKAKTVLHELPAATILRKQLVGEYEGANGRIEIVSRKALLVRGDHEARELDPLLDRKIRNPERFDELTRKIESYLPYQENHPYLRWLQPIATSYYAKYVPKK
jgi:hypothetical protein